MSLPLQVVVSGMAAGGVYGLVAVAHSLVYRLTGIVYFALGDLITLGVFTALLVAGGTQPSTQSVGGARFIAALVVGFLVCVAMSAAGYACAVRPSLIRGSTLGWVASTLALGYFVRSLVSVFFSRPSYVFPDPIPFGEVGNDGFLSVGGASVHARSLLTLTVALALAASAALIVNRGRFARSLRAIADDAEAATLVGIPVDRCVAAAFGLAGGLASVAAVVAAPGTPFGVGTGAEFGYKGLIAALAVGFGSPWASFLAGLALGVIEAGIASLRFGPFELGPQYRDVIPLALAILLIAGYAHRRSELA